MGTKKAKLVLTFSSTSSLRLLRWVAAWVVLSLLGGLGLRHLSSSSTGGLGCASGHVQACSLLCSQGEVRWSPQDALDEFQSYVFELAGQGRDFCVSPEVLENFRRAFSGFGAAAQPVSLGTSSGSFDGSLACLPSPIEQPLARGRSLRPSRKVGEVRLFPRVPEDVPRA